VTAALAREAWRAARGPILGAAAIVVTLTSAPILHAIKWGQVSGVVTLAVLAGVRASWGARSTLAGALLAGATSLKLYPAFMLAAPLARRDRRCLVSWAAACAILLLALPAAVLGPARALQFHREVLADWRANAHRHAADPNSQSFAHVVERWNASRDGLLAPVTSRPQALHRGLVAAGVALAAALVALAALACARRIPAGETWSALLLLGAVPFIVPTSWPHYLVHLPVAQAFAAREISLIPSRAAQAALLVGLLLPSIALGSIAPIAAGVPWRTYVYFGGPFVACAAVTLLLVVILVSKLRASVAPLTSSAR
jgi:hypothetical protein